LVVNLPTIVGLAFNAAFTAVLNLPNTLSLLHAAGAHTIDFQLWAEQVKTCLGAVLLQLRDGSTTDIKFFDPLALLTD